MSPRKCHKNGSHLNCYNFRTVKAINFLFSTPTTPFLCVKIYFAALHLHGADVMRSDTPWDFKTVTSQGRSIQITSNSECAQRSPVTTIDWFCSFLFILSATDILLCEGNVYFPGRFAPINFANRVLFNVWGNYWHAK